MKEKSHPAEAGLKRLLKIIQKLRSKDGCLWDRHQKKEDMAKHILEETYELIDAIDSGSTEELKEEMGDLLFQVLFLAYISEGAGEFNIADVMEAAAEKMIRRHPHIFGNTRVNSVEEIKDNWKKIKNLERKNEGACRPFDNIPRSMPALERAQKVTDAASKVGFDWKRTEDVLVKIAEELDEFRSSLIANDRESMKEEIGDLLLSLVNLSRFANVNAEESLRASVAKFTDRFHYIEVRLAQQGKYPASASLEEMDELWNESKLKD